MSLIKVVALGRKSMHKKGFTLLEIIVSMVILVLTVVGLANLFISGKRWLLHTRSRMSAGELGKYFLDPLQMQVNQTTWNTNCLGTGSAANCPDQNIGQAQGLDRDYTASYTVTPNYPITNLSKVIVNITWTEPE